MQVARPPGGFKIRVKQAVQAYIDAETEDNHRIEQFWEDILARIKFTALKEGTQLKSKGPPTFTYVAEGIPDFQIPTISLVFECFADTLTVTAAFSLAWC